MSTLLEQASLVMIPSGYKEDIVYSPVPTNGNGDLSFTRASNGTRINSAGLVEVTPWNLLQQSETIGGSAWAVVGYTQTTNATTAPNGTNTAELFTLNNGNVAGPSYAIYQPLVFSGEITISVYFKNNNSTGKYVLQTGASQGSEINVVTLAINNFAGCVGSVENVGNGWYRFSTFIPSASNPYFFSYQDGMTGDGSKGIYLWGAQINTGALKPYFPTTDRLNVPRLTYQNGGGGCPSLLLEKQSTNYARKNNDLVDWGVVNSGSLTKNLNAATSPDGTTNAINLVPNTANSAKMIYDNLTLQLAGGNFTMSCYAKANGYSKFGVRESATVGYYATFNLSTGTVIDNGGNTASIENVGNGWYRCIVSVVYSGTVNLGLLPLNDSYTSGQPLSHSYTGDGTKGVLVYGPQLEVSSSYATSLISTAGVASATRVADACFKTGISSLIGQTEGTLYWDGVAVQGNYNQLMFIKDSSVNQFIGMTVGTGVIYGEIYNGGYVHLYIYSIGANDTRFKMALAYKTNSFAFYVNGVQVASSTTGTTPTSFDDFYLGNTNNLRDLNCQVNEAVIFPTRLTNAELASLTTI